MKKLLGAVAVVGVVFAVACGGGDPCSATSKCSADPAPTEASKTACQNQIKDGAKCASQNKAYLECATANQVCGADNKTDQTATSAKCATQAAAVVTCALSSLGDAGM